MSWDLLIAGGGLAGAALAKVQAERGVRVLLLERETAFKDRVRGEGLLPWGVSEARRLGLLDTLLAAGSHEVRWWSVHRDGAVASRRDLVATTPHGLGCLDFHHPAMQEALLQAAMRAGAQVRRGVKVTGVKRGRTPGLVVEGPEGETTLEARHVVIATGRNTHLREAAGFTPHQAPPRLRITGSLWAGLRAPEDSVLVVSSTRQPHRNVLVYPLGQHRFRLYLVRGPGDVADGPDSRLEARELAEACRASGVPADWFEGSEAVGPIATFQGAGSWVEHPHHEGVTLIGDAAATVDPSWGCGMALLMRDVRELCERLRDDEDWDRAGHAYAEAHDGYHGALHRLEHWQTELFYDDGPEAQARKAHALTLQARERDRRLDLVGLGPDAPSDETARRRFFGEDRPR
jgi:2-polyprenyl-6-methoxyphenol hydroxylase-like FAD-dependent oxidoreductase